MKRLLLIGFAALPLALCAQTPLSLDECIELARANNKQIAAADKQLQAAAYELKSMRANFYPSLSATGTGLYSTADGAFATGSGMLPVLGADGVPTGNVAYLPSMKFDYKVGWLYGGGVKLEQPLYMGGKVRTGYRMAKVGNELATQSRRLTEQEVVIQTSRAYSDVVRASELRKVASSYHYLLTELFRQVESAHKNGMKPQNDVLKVQVKLNESELNLRRAENGLRLATMNLCHLIGRPLTDKIEVSNELSAPTAAPASDLSARPEYRLLDRKTELAHQQVLLARSERMPQVGLIGHYGYLHGLELAGQNLLGSWNFAAGVQVSIPIFHFSESRNKMRAAQARYEQTRSEQENTNESMQLEITQSANNLDEAQLEVRLADSSVAAAEENLRLSRRQYEAGTETLSDYLEAQALWQQAYQTQVDARVNSYLCWLEYRKAAGLLN